MDKLLTEPEVCAKLGLSRVGIKSLVENSGFPAPMYLGRGRSIKRYSEPAIEAWLESKIYKENERKEE